ncbi:unnamed protein product, partial [Nesidiocoris tenuis]
MEIRGLSGLQIGYQQHQLLSPGTSEPSNQDGMCSKRSSGQSELTGQFRLALAAPDTIDHYNTPIPTSYQGFSELPNFYCPHNRQLGSVHSRQ